MAAQHGACGPICRLIRNGIQVLLVTPLTVAYRQKAAQRLLLTKCSRVSCLPACLALVPLEEPGCQGHAHRSGEGSWAPAVAGHWGTGGILTGLRPGGGQCALSGQGAGPVGPIGFSFHLPRPLCTPVNRSGD